MSKNWSLERLKSATIAIRTATYEGVPSNEQEEMMKKNHPEVFSFEAISIGDDNGQAFLVPLDESSRETAELILKAIAAYKDSREDAEEISFAAGEAAQKSGQSDDCHACAGSGKKEVGGMLLTCLACDGTGIRQ